MKINQKKGAKNNDNDEKKEKHNNFKKSEERNNNFDAQKENQNNSNLKEDKEENNEIILNTKNLLKYKKNKEDNEIMSFKKDSIGNGTPSNKYFSNLKEKESQKINYIKEIKNDLNKTTINKLYLNGNYNSNLSKPNIMEKLSNSDKIIFEQDKSPKSRISEKVYNNKYYLNKSKNTSVFLNNISLLKNESMIKEKISNSTNNSNDINNFIDKKQSIKTNKEKIYYNSFINLSSTKENSFLINSSYENINKFSNNKYINDITLRKKTKQFIINECKKADLFPIKKELKKYSESIPIFPKIKINYEKKKYSKHYFK